MAKKGYPLFATDDAIPLPDERLPVFTVSAPSPLVTLMEKRPVSWSIKRREPASTLVAFMIIIGVEEAADLEGAGGNPADLMQKAQLQFLEVQVLL
jgi:hypothetical protein